MGLPDMPINGPPVQQPVAVSRQSVLAVPDVSGQHDLLHGKWVDDGGRLHVFVWSGLGGTPLISCVLKLSGRELPHKRRIRETPHKNKSSTPWKRSTWTLKTTGWYSENTLPGARTSGSM